MENWETLIKNCGVIIVYSSHKGLIKGVVIMNKNEVKQEAPQNKPWWWHMQSGQALAEYWPTIPAAIMVMITAAAIVGPVGRIFHRTSDALNLVVCGDAPPAYFTLPIGSVVEVLGANYDSGNDRTTFTLSVPGDSNVILGLTEEEAQRITQASEDYNSYQSTSTGDWQVSFDGSNSGIQTSDGREITLTLTGQADFVNNLPVTVVDDSDHASSGYLYTTVSYTGEDCVNQSGSPSNNSNQSNNGNNGNNSKIKTKGNNGLGNGFDDQPPGNPPENDTCADAAPGSPCNKGGVNNDNGNGGNSNSNGNSNGNGNGNGNGNH